MYCVAYRGVLHGDPKCARVTAEKLDVLDVYRGAAILAVLGIHLSGHLLHTVGGEGFGIFNRAMLFAVPSFLLMSAFLNARSLASGKSLQQYTQNRVRKAVPPYLVWSVVGWIVAFHLYPDDLYNAREFSWCLLWGKCYFHLYFLIVVLQLYLLLPLLRPLVARRPPLWAMLLGGALVQGAIYAVNYRWHVFPYVGSVVFWHLPEVTLGLWLAGQADRFDELMQRGMVPAVLTALLALAVFATLNPHLTTLYQGIEWVYTAAASYALLALCQRMRYGWLRWCGVHSMAIYLIHPFVMYALDKKLPAMPWPVATAIYAGLCLTVPVLIEGRLPAGRLRALLLGG